MLLPLRTLACAFTILTLCAGIGVSKLQPPALEPQSMKNFKKPLPHKGDGQAQQFSMEKALYALDSASLDWWRSKCFTCHTNVPYLYARPLVSGNDPAPQEVRQQLEQTVDAALKAKRGQNMSDFYATSAATALAINDSITTKKLHPLTKQALDHMWTQMRSSGNVAWGGGVVPVGSQHFGAAITFVAVSVAPEGYAQTEEAKKGLEKLRTWLTKNPAKTLYDKAMILWAASHVDGILTAEEKATIIADLRGKQLGSGGWSLPTLATSPMDGATADGYATGLAIYALRQAGIPANDPAIVKGIAWLKGNQLESGRWPTQSVSRGTSSYLTNTGSVFAVMALHSCTEVAPAQAQAPAQIQLRLKQQ